MTSLHYLDSNPAGNPVVLLLHGLGADANSWILQIPALSTAGFRPIAVDIPGFGQSPFDGNGWSIRRVAADMADLLEELQSGPAHIVGLSLGGTVAQQFAMDNPLLTRKLVLVSTFAVLRPDNLSGWYYFIQRFILVYTHGLPAQAKVVAQRIFPDPRDEQVRKILVETISRADLRVYRKAMASLGLFNSVNRLIEIKAPTLVVTGAEDTTVNPARQRLLVDGIPNARQVIVPNAGHAVPVDQRERFNKELLEFLGTN
ncbi:MAG: alpha/beta hydrolase [Anaerolineales bacterium]|jgi:pimeloyl-ACP methyl ester carboxylesterase